MRNVAQDVLAAQQFFVRNVRQILIILLIRARIINRIKELENVDIAKRKLREKAHLQNQFSETSAKIQVALA